MATNPNLQTIKLHKGDSSNFFYAITVNIDTDLDLTGWTGYFEVGEMSAMPVDGVPSKTVSIVINSENTRVLSEGKHTAYLKLITNTGLIGTLEPLFIIHVLPEVVHV